jgi:hypothetical protein
MISGDLRLVACYAARTLFCSTVLLATSIPQESRAQGATSRGNEGTHVATSRGKADPAVTSEVYPVFDKNSFWYQPIPKNVTLHEKSEIFASDFARQVKTYFGHIGINSVDYSSPVYTVGPDVPKVRVVPGDCWGNDVHDANPSLAGVRSAIADQLAEDFAAVPIPSYAEPAGGTDSEMSIYQPGTDTLWEFWNAHKVEGVWKTCWGGRMSNVSSNPGIWQKPYGAAATGLPFAPGQILIDELRRGEIRHALGVAIVEAEEKTYSWPANRSDGTNPNKIPNRIPEGLRMRLDPTIDVESLNLHPIAKTIARAAQTYGFVVWDLGGSVALRAENPKRYTTIGLPNPYASLYGSMPIYKIMDRFPWDKMQFLPMDYGKPQ